MGRTELKVKDSPLWLLPEKAVFMPETATLLVADTHFGKSLTFQTRGIALPFQTELDDVLKIRSLQKELKAQRLIVLGDILHASSATDFLSLTPLFSSLAEPFETVEFVLGNHDKGLQPQYFHQFNNIYLKEDMVEGAFCFSHFPQTSDKFVFSGHIHPKFLLRAGRQTLNLPIFWLKEEGLILPSFGATTGGYNIQKKAHDRIFAVAEDSVLEME